MNPSIALDPFHLLQKTCFSSWTAPWPACLLNAWTARDHVDMILLLPCPFLTTAAIMGLVGLGDWTEFWKSRIKRDTIPFFLPLISLPLPSHGIITWMYGQFCFWQVTKLSDKYPVSHVVEWGNICISFSFPFPPQRTSLGHLFLEFW